MQYYIYIYVDPSPRPNAEDTNQGNQVIPWPAAWYSDHVLVAKWQERRNQNRPNDADSSHPYRTQFYIAICSGVLLLTTTHARNSASAAFRGKA